MKIKRGDIFLADLGEGYGSEQGGILPCSSGTKQQRK